MNEWLIEWVLIRSSRFAHEVTPFVRSLVSSLLGGERADVLLQDRRRLESALAAGLELVVPVGIDGASRIVRRRNEDSASLLGGREGPVMVPRRRQRRRLRMRRWRRRI